MPSGYGRECVLCLSLTAVCRKEDGVLALAKPGPDKLEVLSKFQLFEDRSWTIPTLVGNRLFVRNNESIVALELG